MKNMNYKSFTNNENCWSEMSSCSNVGNFISSNDQLYIHECKRY